MLELKTGLLQLWHWQPDALITLLDIIHCSARSHPESRLDLIHPRLDLIHNSAKSHPPLFDLSAYLLAFHVSIFQFTCLIILYCIFSRLIHYLIQTHNLFVPLWTSYWYCIVAIVLSYQIIHIISYSYIFLLCFKISNQGVWPYYLVFNSYLWIF